MLYSIIRHPIGFLVVTLSQAFLICILSWILSKTRWFSFIIFLIFLGGLMVLFIYITRLASNEIIYSTPWNEILLKSFIATFILTTVIFFSKNIISTIESLNYRKSIFNIYNSMFIILVILSIIYLLLTLIVVVKIANQISTPIKSVI